MRARVTIILVWVGFVSATAWPDTIHLKNGRTILADRVSENGSHYQYDVGDDSYAIPKSLVDHVDAGGMPAHLASSGGTAKTVGDLPTFTPADSLAHEGDLPPKIIKDGNVDPAPPPRLEGKNNSALIPTPHFLPLN